MCAPSTLLKGPDVLDVNQLLCDLAYTLLTPCLPLPQMLDENHHLIQCILDYQSKGKTAECTQ